MVAVQKDKDVQPKRKFVMPKLPRWEWYKWLAFFGYSFFAFIYMYALCQGAYTLFAPGFDWAREKLSPTIAGGQTAEMMYADLNAEFLGDDITVHPFGPVSYLTEGEAFKECRLFCVNNPKCVFFSIYSEDYSKDKAKTKCFLKGLDVSQRRSTPDFDSGVLLYRIPNQQMPFFGPKVQQVFSSIDDLEDAMHHGEDPMYTGKEHDAHEDIDTHESFGMFKGPASQYFSRFIPEEVVSIVDCFQKCSARGQGVCEEFIYQRSIHMCFQKSSISFLTKQTEEEEQNAI